MTDPVTDPVTDPEARAEPSDSLVTELSAMLDALDGLPVAEHVAVFEAAHERLRTALTDADDATGALGSAALRPGT